MGINGFLLAFAIFIIIAMSIYWGFFEEWTIWTDYTMAWVKCVIDDANARCTAFVFLGGIQLLHLLLGSFDDHSCLSVSDLYLWFRSSDQYVDEIFAEDIHRSLSSSLVMAFQIHAYRHRNVFLMQYVPYSLFTLAVITILGGLAWFAVTMINMNAGFMTKETFLLERLRFKGNAFKDLKYREESFHLVTQGRVPPRIFILTAFVNQ